MTSELRLVRLVMGSFGVTEMFDDDIYETAVRAYTRNHDAQPSRHLSDVREGHKGWVVTLANINGELARYKVTDTSGRLRAFAIEGGAQ